MIQNPVFWLEMRIRSREKRLWIIALLALLVMTVVLGLVLAFFFVESSHSAGAETAQVGVMIGWPVLWCHCGLMVLLAPLASAGRISSEREQRTYPALRNTPLSSSGIFIGKLLGSWMFVIWLGSITLPFLAIAYIWGGMKLSILLAGFVFNTLAGLTLSTLGLGLSSWFGRSLSAYLCSGGLLILWLIVSPLIGWLLLFLNETADAPFEDVIPFATFYHLPCFPLIALAMWGGRTAGFPVVPSLLWALFVWLVLGLLGAVIARKGLKRDVY